MRITIHLVLLLMLLVPVAGWTQVEETGGEESGEVVENGESPEADAGEETEGGEATGDDAEGLAANPGQQKGCTSYWTGTFQYVSKGRKGIKFKRRRKKQIEINRNTGEKSKYKVEWISNCDYVLTFKKSNKDNKLKKGWTVETKIVETYDEFYGYKADQYGILSEGVIQKILSKRQTKQKVRKEKRAARKEAKDKARKIEEEEQRLKDEELEKRIEEYDEFNNYDPEIAKIIEKRKKKEEKNLGKEEKKKMKEEKWAKKQKEKEEESAKTKDEKKAEKAKKKGKQKEVGKRNVFARVYDKTLGKLINKIFKKKAKSKVEGELREIGG